ncbi:Pleiotropic drug resistance protein TUR2 [Acorus gramineus]|uniref:Pleiotropic drug resistance protein TUR2 n=1 Tax=Acorus gramineus TaxID=55184 RepID=A0AAV9AKG2_ACOGR|nr:Pleiotropic drug resistance protein TUR2 [Acorus gramineus]
MLMELSRREKAANIKPDPDIDVYMKASSIEGQESVVVDYILKILGLEICADTMVGDQMMRGISGGQKKRVTTGEMLVGPSKALFMDEISTGLDSSTTFQIVNSIRQSVHILEGTALIALLQPAPETYDLFDDIILLSEGQIVYQGPRENVVEFFESMGFKCPERKGVADFLQEVTSRKDQAQYWSRRDEPYRFISVQEFSVAFQSFHVGRAVAEALSTPFDRNKNHPAALTTSEYGINKKELFKACLERELVLMKRNAFVYIFKVNQLIIIATITMTVFLRNKMHHRNVEDGQIYMGALFVALLALLFNGFAELAMSIAKLPVFYKQRDLLFFPGWAYALPSWFTKMPISFIECAVWTGLTYYVIGYDPYIERFFRQYLILVLVSQMSSALFRFLGSVGRNMVIASTFGSFAQLVLMVLGGFVLSRTDIKKWWKWGYWASPLMYAQNAIVVNEFLGKKWEQQIGNKTLGALVLESRGFFPEARWFWIGTGALIGYILLLNGLYTLALSYLDSIDKGQTLVSEEALREKHANRTGEQIELVSKRAEPRGGEIRRINQSQKKGMVLPFEPLSIVFDEICYSVDMPPEMKARGVEEDRLVLLKNLSGAFRPGVLTALMGVSGAGKTTLMDVLAGRKTGGYIEGNINISGYPKNQETFARISGYCEQTDIHSPHVTVYESLVFSAWLRLSTDVDGETRKMFIEEVMELVELNSLRNSLVGLPGVNGLSTEQRKRLTIAVELVANPSIIFMDEPTSGLDARAAAIVMRTVRNTVDTGRTVVCTIHQPSIDIFEAFDEGIDGVSKIKDQYNPATWMLEVTSASQEELFGVDFTQIYKNSDLRRRNKALISELSVPPPSSKDLYFPTQYSQSFLTQCLACLWKQHKSYWRNPAYTATRIFFTTVIALMFGSIFWKLGSKRTKRQDLFNAMGSMYAAVLFIGIQNAQTVQPIVDVERTVFYREKAAGMYSALPYAFAQVAIEIPYVLFQTLIYGVIVYSMINFQWTAVKFLWYLFFMFLSFLYFTYYGMMAVAVTPNSHIAAVVATAFYGIWNLFAGFVIPRPMEDTGVQETVQQFLKRYFGFKHDFLGGISAALIGFDVLFAFVFAYSIKVFNFQTR